MYPIFENLKGSFFVTWTWAREIVVQAAVHLRACFFAAGGSGTWCGGMRMEVYGGHEI